MNHDDTGTLVTGFVLCALEPEDQEVFQEHLATCQQCAHDVTEMAALVGWLPLLAEDRDPPSRLRERILGGVNGEMVAVPRSQASI